MLWSASAKEISSAFLYKAVMRLDLDFIPSVYETIFSFFSQARPLSLTVTNQTTLSFLSSVLGSVCVESPFYPSV